MHDQDSSWNYLNYRTHCNSHEHSFHRGSRLFIKVASVKQQVKKDTFQIRTNALLLAPLNQEAKEVNFKKTESRLLISDRGGRGKSSRTTDGLFVPASDKTFIALRAKCYLSQCWA